MSHANARLTPAGRLLMVRRVEAGMPQAHVARQMGLSPGTVAKWWRRWCELGEAGLADRFVAASSLSSAHSWLTRSPAQSRCLTGSDRRVGASRPEWACSVVLGRTVGC